MKKLIFGFAMLSSVSVFANISEIREPFFSRHNVNQFLGGTTTNPTPGRPIRTGCSIDFKDNYWGGQNAILGLNDGTSIDDDNVKVYLPRDDSGFSKYSVRSIGTTKEISFSTESKFGSLGGFMVITGDVVTSYRLTGVQLSLSPLPSGASQVRNNLKTVECHGLKPAVYYPNDSGNY